ncbi:MAG TPA: hypothetical protein VNO30_31545 [Kofleriaceae bacterium]|nr:hypothetical protein [Kofleriaceae bacterium]
MSQRPHEKPNSKAPQNVAAEDQDRSAKLVAVETVTPRSFDASARQRLEDELYAYWERSHRPGVQFFLRENPGYGEGHGLLTILPLTIGGVVRFLARYTLAKGERRARRLAARTYAGVAEQLLAPAGAAYESRRVW